jgi:lipopolysaccharide export system protein LptA
MGSKLLKLGALLLPVVGAGAYLEITAETFKYDPKREISIFQGNVKAKKGGDYIYSHRMEIFLKRKKVVKYLATGNVRFRITLDPKDIYQGRADRLIYWVQRGDLVLEGNCSVKNLRSGEQITGEYIKLNRYTKGAEVKGGKRPVKVILELK